MKTKKKINFDLSTLTLKELVKTYDDIFSFIKFLNDNKIVKEKVNDKNG